MTASGGCSSHAIRGPYCTGASAPAVAVAFDAVPAAAFPLDQPVLGHLGANRLQVKDLPALHGGDRAVRQPGTAPAAAARLMADLPVRPDRLPQRHPLVPVLPAGLAAARLRSSLAEASRPSLGGHVGAFFRVYPCGKPNDSIRGVDLNHPVEAAKGRRVFELRPADNPY